MENKDTLSIGKKGSHVILYPDRFKIADATEHMPFPDSSFDVVLACLSLPNYARNPQEVINSILEMIRVAKEKVVFTTSFPDISAFPILPPSGHINCLPCQSTAYPLIFLTLQELRMPAS
ncbi:MAG: methyltransferase domain-containing protein [Candidatus Curtissbacteria bacterium]|nr:methyltransferase domain-containing protein [Candidatus Curtissbacteria bacterium]